VRATRRTAGWASWAWWCEAGPGAHGCASRPRPDLWRWAGMVRLSRGAPLRSRAGSPVHVGSAASAGHAGARRHPRSGLACGTRAAGWASRAWAAQGSQACMGSAGAGARRSAWADGGRVRGRAQLCHVRRGGPLRRGGILGQRCGADLGAPGAGRSLAWATACSSPASLWISRFDWCLRAGGHRRAGDWVQGLRVIGGGLHAVRLAVRVGRGRLPGMVGACVHRWEQAGWASASSVGNIALSLGRGLGAPVCVGGGVRARGMRGLGGRRSTVQVGRRHPGPGRAGERARWATSLGCMGPERQGGLGVVGALLVERGLGRRRLGALGAGPAAA
jgi:hypothetical protein